MRNDAIIVICTRIQSSRVSKKIFRKINGKPALLHLLERLGDNFRIVLAVPQEQIEQYREVLAGGFHHVALWESRNQFFDESPLHRMAAVMVDYKNAPFVIRITHDDILIDIKTIEEMVDIAHKGYDYVCSPKIIEGAGAEVIRTDLLIEAAKNYLEPSEYISYHVKPADTAKTFYHTPRPEITRNYNLCMDYPQDVIALEAVFRNVGNGAELEKIVKFLDENTWARRINEKPKLSIYTCAYNSGKYLGQTLESLFPYGMNLNDVEYIFVDDFSRDDTLNIFCQYAHRPNVTVMCNEQNMGLGSSSNLAISKAKGKYIMRMDSDDIAIWKGIFRMVEQMEEKETAIIYPDYIEMDYYGAELGTVKGGVYHHAGGAMMNRRMINELRFKEGIRHWDGMELLTKLVKLNFERGYSDTPAFKYRLRPDSLSHSGSEERKNAKKEMELFSGK
jgi:spore coat polysaccharide biosynthesis protein SpsF (cytidylyltransferase family)